LIWVYRGGKGECFFRLFIFRSKTFGHSFHYFNPLSTISFLLSEVLSSKPKLLQKAKKDAVAIGARLRFRISFDDSVQNSEL